MTDHPMVEALLRRANPVPNPAAPPAGTWSADVALLDIERRSSTMQTQERTTTPPTEPDRPRRGLLVFAAAFVLAIVVIGSVALFSGEDPAPPIAPPTTEPTTTSEPTTTQAPTTTEAPAPTTTTISPPSTTLTPEELAWQATPLLTIAGEPGEKRTNGFTPEYRFTVPGGWRPIESGSDLWVIGSIVDGEEPPIDIVVMRPEIGTVAETVEEILTKGQPDDQPLVTDAEIDGARGVLFTFLPSESTFTPSRLELTTGFYPFDPEWRQAVYVVDVDGTTVVVMVRSHFEFQDESSNQEATMIAESIRWRVPLS